MFTLLLYSFTCSRSQDPTNTAFRTPLLSSHRGKPTQCRWLLQSPPKVSDFQKQAQPPAGVFQISPPICRWLPNKPTHLPVANKPTKTGGFQKLTHLLVAPTPRPTHRLVTSTKAQPPCWWLPHKSWPVFSSCAASHTLFTRLCRVMSIKNCHNNN